MSDRIARTRAGIHHFRHGRALSLVAALAILAGCSDGSDGGKSGNLPPEQPTLSDYVNAPVTGPVATIRRTTGGVPHIKADNLESVAFGAGYVQAQDNVCLIADAIV
jgi:acyl-homoserine-lactone acylase